MTTPGPAPAWLAGLEAQGMSTTWSPAGHCWVRFKRVAHLRYPTNDLAPLGADERRALLWRRRMAVLQYHEPAGIERANASLYLCTTRDYGIDVLSSNNRSKVRRGLKRFEVRETSAAEVLAAGYPSYADTRARHGSGAMTPEQFRANWERQLEVPGREIWAAWAGAEIAAFGTVHRCGRWASISATVSDRAHLRDYPNHALFFTMLEHLMADPSVESVSYGLSSLRAETARESLHSFKVSIGLEAVPVVRKVVLHPLLRPAVNHGSLAVAGAAARRAPEARLPKAARAALEFLLEPDADGADDAP
ncbi:GNAT family N-acetyltransferase [Aquihabitans sp. G128]|uniref:GNAT family N-acetyltransferase n=1 Tax=Aquihabitans sp. G128 TaxID=2849779 RepID=UPI001C24A083|nr:GNAT family N-acetyltransferase [Aquihabitans sp. G128]QXC60271.1 GNAT family N-acetyltransferase [Aquihabitans sp. G128]